MVVYRGSYRASGRTACALLEGLQRSIESPTTEGYKRALDTAFHDFEKLRAYSDKSLEAALNPQKKQHKTMPGFSPIQTPDQDLHQMQLVYQTQQQQQMQMQMQIQMQQQQQQQQQQHQAQHQMQQVQQQDHIQKQQQQQQPQQQPQPQPQPQDISTNQVILVGSIQREDPTCLGDVIPVTQEHDPEVLPDVDTIADIPTETTPIQEAPPPVRASSRMRSIEDFFKPASAEGDINPPGSSR
jgi:hypothetical protein